MTMNATPDHLDDEILSALLDGDGGDTDVAAHLRACDRCAGRQGELVAARAALAGAPVEPVDELTRRRLLAAALAAAGEETATAVAAIPARARARWASRHPALIGSAAAVVLAVLVGIPFVVGNDSKSGDADTTLTAQAPSELTQESASSYLGDLGDLSDRENLRLRLTSSQLSDTYGYGAPLEPSASPAAGASSPAPGASPAPMSGGLASTTTAGRPGTANRSSGGSGSGSTSEKAASAPAADAATSNQAAQASDEAARRDRADTDACVAALLNGPAKGGRLTASGTGIFQNRPAIVAVFDLAGGRVAFVADRSGCGVLDRFSV
jgi:negative regulator of sigma E activity